MRETSASKITIVSCCDSRYVLGIAVLLRSLAERAAHASDLHVFLIDAGLRRDHRCRLQCLARDAGIFLRILHPDLSSLSPLPRIGRWGLTCYVRLLLADLLPADVDRVLYLDADIMALASIDELWQVELGRAPLGAVLNYPKHAEEALSPARCQKLGLAPNAPYFNSGVLLIDIDHWRREGMTHRLISSALYHAASLQFPDQDVLNAVFTGQWHSLDFVWNVPCHRIPHLGRFHNLARQPRLLHFNSQFKPWHAQFTLPEKEHFFAYIDRTPWSGWRPSSVATPASTRLSRSFPPSRARTPQI